MSHENQLIAILSKNYALETQIQFCLYRAINKSAVENMDIEIIKYINHLDKLMINMDALRMECFHLLQKALFDYFQGACNVQALVYGSVSTGLALEGSDMDIVFRGLEISSREQLEKEYANIKLYLEKTYPCITYIKLILTAKVPIMKLVIKMDQTEIKIDVLISEKIHEESLYMRCFSSVEMIKDILSKFKHTREIVILLKRILSVKGLNSTYKGGLSSYSLVLMVSTFLNHFPHIESISEKLINAMLFYGSYMDVCNIGISPILYSTHTGHISQSRLSNSQ